MIDRRRTVYQSVRDSGVKPQGTYCTRIVRMGRIRALYDVDKKASMNPALSPSPSAALRGPAETKGVKSLMITRRGRPFTSPKAPR